MFRGGGVKRDHGTRGIGRGTHSSHGFDIAAATTRPPRWPGDADARWLSPPRRVMAGVRGRTTGAYRAVPGPSRGGDGWSGDVAEASHAPEDAQHTEHTADTITHTWR